MARSCRLQAQRTGGKAQSIMGGGDDDAAGRAMRPHQFGGQAAAGAVQRGERLVQQPEGAARQHQPRQAQPFLLAGGKIAAGKGPLARKPDPLQHGRYRAVRAIEMREEFQLLANAQLRLDAVLMS